MKVGWYLPYCAYYVYYYLVQILKLHITFIYIEVFMFKWIMIVVEQLARPLYKSIYD